MLSLSKESQAFAATDPRRSHSLPGAAGSARSPAPPRPRPSETPPPDCQGRAGPASGPRVASSRARPCPLLRTPGSGPTRSTCASPGPAVTPEQESAMAAPAKAENLSLVVHGPGDLRLVKRESGGGGDPGRHPPRPASPLCLQRQSPLPSSCHSQGRLLARTKHRWLPRFTQIFAGYREVGGGVAVSGPLFISRESFWSRAPGS